MKEGLLNGCWASERRYLRPQNVDVMQVADAGFGELQQAFPNTKGFPAQNLWYMRQLFTEYNKSQLLQPVVGEISWTKHLIAQFFPTSQELVKRVEMLTKHLAERKKP